MCNPQTKTEPKKIEYIYFGNCLTGGIQRIPKKDKNKMKINCEKHNEERWQD